MDGMCGGQVTVCVDPWKSLSCRRSPARSMRERPPGRADRRKKRHKLNGRSRKNSRNYSVKLTHDFRKAICLTLSLGSVASTFGKVSASERERGTKNQQMEYQFETICRSLGEDNDGGSGGWQSFVLHVSESIAARCSRSPRNDVVPMLQIFPRDGCIFDDWIVRRSSFVVRSTQQEMLADTQSSCTCRRFTSRFAFLFWLRFGFGRSVIHSIRPFIAVDAFLPLRRTRVIVLAARDASARVVQAAKNENPSTELHFVNGLLTTASRRLRTTQFR